MNRPKFVDHMTQMLKESYTIEKDFVDKSLANLEAGNKPSNVIEMMVEGNLKYLDKDDNLV